MNPTLPVSLTLRDLERDMVRVGEILDRMAKLAVVADEDAARRFLAAKDLAEFGVKVYRIGKGNPYPSVPAFDIGGES